MKVFLFLFMIAGVSGCDDYVLVRVCNNDLLLQHYLYVDQRGDYWYGVNPDKQVDKNHLDEVCRK